MARKQILDKELRRQLREADQLYDSELDDGSSDEDGAGHEPHRGRRFIQFAWSRVICIKDDLDAEIVEHWIRRDQIIHSRVRADNKRLTVVKWEPLFMPDDFAAKTDVSDLEKFRLNERQLKRHAQNICKLRKELRLRALKIINEAQEGLDIGSYEIPKLQRWAASDRYNYQRVEQLKISG
jgi:hypothetical protein